jgi:phosphatidylserine decarboxylase
MLRRMITPLHPDGFKFVLVGAAATLVLFLLWVPAGWIAGIVTLWLAYFFRDPWRVTPIRPGLLVSPADGIVVSLAPAPPPPELAMGEAALTRIGIFLSIFDVHVTRAPLGGRVAAQRYTKGRFVNAIHDDASRHNERMATRIRPSEGPDIAFVQVAGFLARRIVCDLREGQELATGQRVGIIRFGSRVDVYCPPPYVPMVIAGQRVVGGETVLADRLAQEPPRQGFAQ